MSLKQIAQEIKDSKEFMPEYETINKDDIIGLEVEIAGYTLYDSKKDMYKDHPKTVIIAMIVDGRKVKAHFHNTGIVETFTKVEETKANVIGEKVKFVKVKLGDFDSLAIE